MVYEDLQCEAVWARLLEGATTPGGHFVVIGRQSGVHAGQAAIASLCTQSSRSRVERDHLLVLEEVAENTTYICEVWPRQRAICVGPGDAIIAIADAEGPEPVRPDCALSPAWAVKKSRSRVPGRIKTRRGYGPSVKHDLLWRERALLRLANGVQQLFHRSAALEFLALQGPPRVRLWLATTPKIDISVAYLLSISPEREIRRELASRGDLSQGLYWELFRVNPELFYSLARNDAFNSPLTGCLPLLRIGTVQAYRYLRARKAANGEIDSEIDLCGDPDLAADISVFDFELMI